MTTTRNVRKKRTSNTNALTTWQCHEVYLAPMGKPRLTQQDKWRKRPEVLRYWTWCAELRKAICSHPDKKLDIDVLAMQVTAIFDMPKSWSAKKKRELSGNEHRQLPDCDNIMKAVMDALLKKDQGVSRIECHKRWARDGESAMLKLEIGY